MTLQDRLMDDLKRAMRKGDKTRVSTIRMLRAAIKNAEIAQGKSLDDAAVLGVVAKEAKQRRESIAEFSKGNRPDLVSQEEAELSVLLGYLPRQMSRDEIVAAARQVIQEVGATGPADKGKVMSRLMPQLKGKAEGQVVNTVVSELLAGS